MLSKLRYFLSTRQMPHASRQENIDVSPALVKTGLSGGTINRLDAGTLSASFIAEKSGKRKFFKTYTNSGGDGALLKEFALLAALYPTELSPECIEIGRSTDKRIWLVMNVLDSSQVEQTPDDLACFTQELRCRLHCFKNHLLIPQEDSIFTLLALAWEALADLSAHGLLVEEIQRSAKYHLEQIETKICAYKPCICHGDLGPQNLLSDGKHSLAIDWEDSFWGIEGYDYLYWLTFFQNRKYYSPAILEKTPLGKQLELSVLVMILLLKSELSFCNGQYRYHTLDFNQRINEMLLLQ